MTARFRLSDAADDVLLVLAAGRSSLAALAPLNAAGG